MKKIYTHSGPGFEVPQCTGRYRTGKSLTVGILMPLKGGVPRPQTLSISDRWHWAHCIVLGGRNMLPLVEK